MMKNCEPRLLFNAQAMKLSQMSARSTQLYNPKWQEEARRWSVALRQQLRELDMILEQEAKESFER